MQRRELPRRLGPGRSRPSRRCQGHRQPRCSAKVLNAIAQHVPWLIGGAADLAPSTKTLTHGRRRGRLRGREPWRPQPAFRHSRARHGRDRQRLGADQAAAYGSGFLIFSDYMRPPIRLAAIMELPVDLDLHPRFDRRRRGRADAPAGRAAVALRAIPGLITIRPGDANEVAEAWRALLQMKQQPVCLILSRQPLPTLDRSVTPRPLAWPAAPMSWPTRRGRGARGDPDRHRQRGLALRAGLRGADRRGRARARGVHAVLGAVRAAGRELSRRRCCRPR